MPDVRWIKITTNIFDDEKIKLIEQLPDSDTLLIIWFKLLVLAGRCNQCGMVFLSRDIPYTDEMLATIMRRNINAIRLALNEFNNLKMIEIQDNFISIMNWKKHQNIDGLAKIREQNRIRQQNYRVKLSDNKSNVISRDGNALDKSREDKKRKEKKKSIWVADAPPLLKDIEFYIKSKNYNVDANTFYDYYTESNWIDSTGKKVFNWKMKIVTWNDNSKNKKNEQESESKYELLEDIE